MAWVKADFAALNGLQSTFNSSHGAIEGHVNSYRTSNANVAENMQDNAGGAHVDLSALLEQAARSKQEVLDCIKLATAEAEVNFSGAVARGVSRLST